MNRDRLMRAKRRGLNPTKAVFVYCLAFILVAFHQSGRVADWFEDLALKHEGGLSDFSFAAAEFIRNDLQPYGPRQFNQIEDWLLALFSETPPAPAPAPAEDGRPLQTAGAGKPGEEQPPAIPSVLDDPLVLHVRPEKETGPEEEPYAELPPAFWAPDPAATKPNQSQQKPPVPVPVPAPPAGPNHIREQIAALPPTPPPSVPLQTGVPVLKPSTVLLLGDSMMLEGLGPPLQRALKKNENLAVYRDGRYGTGLTRLDNFDWLSYFDEALAKYEPDLVILTLGANDPQDMVDTGKRVHLGTETWNRNYADRVSDLLKRAQKRGATVFWVGLPIMGRQPYGGRIEAINKIAAEACGAAPNCRFWDSWLSVADARGQYAVFIKDKDGKSIRIRGKDNIHLTEAGGRIMAEKFLAETAAWADYSQKSEADEAAAPTSGEAQLPPAPSAGEADDDGDEGELSGRLEQRSFFSEIRGKNTSYYLAEPVAPADEPGRGLPVVFMLHGAWDGHDAWVKNLGPDYLARQAQSLGLILVMADGEPFGWYVDGRQSSIESYFIKELLPEVLAKTPRADPDRLGLMGLSMGGHGALTLALKHPQLFKAAGALSALTDLSAHAGRRHPVDKQLKLAEALGPAGADGRAWRPFSAAGLIEADPAAWGGRPLIISFGQDDSLVSQENIAFHQLLDRLNIKHSYRPAPGGHDWKYWAAEIPVQLQYLGEHL